MVLTILSIVVGYLTLCINVALLFGAWSSVAGAEITNEFLAFAAVCSLGFATLSGWLTALVAQRAPITHAAGLAIFIAIMWSITTFGGATSEPLAIALLNLAVGIVGVMAGGWIRLRQMKARDAIAEKS